MVQATVGELAQGRRRAQDAFDAGGQFCCVRGAVGSVLSRG